MSDTNVARLEAKVDAVAHRLDLLIQEKKPSLTIEAFAKAAGLNRKTIYRHIKSGSLYRVKGRIPYELLKSYLS